MPSSRAARLGTSSAVVCAYLDAVARVVLQGTCHVPPHPRRSPQLTAEKGPWATRQCGGPAPCERGRADRLSGVSRLARAAAPHSAYRDDVPERHGDQAQLGSAAVRRLVEGGKLSIVKSEQWWMGPNAAPIVIAASRYYQRTANASAPPVLTTAHASFTYVWTRAGNADTAEGARGHVTHPDPDS